LTSQALRAQVCIPNILNFTALPNSEAKRKKWKWPL